jgi:lipoate---protein ligase
MQCIISPSSDPYFNLAIEEILLKRSKEQFLILGINDTCVIIGKHQSAHREINTKFIDENKIPVIRRISGGGTVFHDPANLNFTFILQSEHGKQVNFQDYTRPVIDFLASEGVDAKFEGKNDLKVNGLKISGNAEHVHHDRVLHHGTLLFNSSLDIMRDCLRKDCSGYSSKAVVSNPSPVTNLSGMLPQYKDVSEFRIGMMDYFLDYFHGFKYELSDEEKGEAKSLTASKYKTWEWNYAYGPDYQFSNAFIFKDIKASCQLYVREGTIRNCILKGSRELEPIASKLTGSRHMPGDILQVLNDERIEGLDVFNFF